MNDELVARHRAITLRLAGRPVKVLCAAVGRSEVRFRSGGTASWKPAPRASTT